MLYRPLGFANGNWGIRIHSAVRVAMRGWKRMENEDETANAPMGPKKGAALIKTSHKVRRHQKETETRTKETNPSSVRVMIRFFPSAAQPASVGHIASVDLIRVIYSF